MRLETSYRGSLGLRVLIASLLAIAVVLALTLKYQQSLAADHVREEGINLARLVTQLPGTNEQRLAGWKQVFAYQHRSEHFAYAMVADQALQALVDVTASGVIVPPAVVAEGGGWVNEARGRQGDAQFIEFYGPIRVNGGLGSYRIGYFNPGFSISTAQLPEIASLMLPVFLLVPLFLYFLKREVTPLKAVNAEMAAVLAGGETGKVVNDPRDLRSFAEQFNQFMAHAKEQIAEYQDEAAKRVTSEKFLNYRLHRLEVLLDSTPDGLIVIDDECCVTFANAPIRRLLSLDPQKLIGQKIGECLQHPELVAYFVKHQKNIGKLVGEAMEFALPDRSDVVFSACVQRLHEPNSHSHVVIFHDVSRETRARRSRSEFVAHLAHELKAPLNTLALYSEALQSGDDQSAEFQLESANVINDEVERLARLINNLLSMTQIEMGTLQLDRQRVKLVDLVKDATETMQKSARDRQLTFVLDLPNEVIPVQVDKDLLRIAINNLLTNAIKYTDPGGTITVSVTETDDAVSICVADTGIGISAVDQAQIFNKFYRATGAGMEERQGHGLGLPLALDVVHLHHGSIRVESTLGAGSRFYIDLWKHSGVMQQAI